MYSLPPQRLHIKQLPSLQDSSLKGYSEYKLITDLVYVIRVNAMPVMKPEKWVSSLMLIDTGSLELVPYVLVVNLEDIYDMKSYMIILC